MSRILYSIAIVAALIFCATPALAQSTCPKQEIFIFGSTYGYSSQICKKDGDDCSTAPSAHILVYGGKVSKVGCKDAPACDQCKTPQATISEPKGEPKNWVYKGRQIFLDTTNGVSKLKSLGFARVTTKETDTYFAVFEIRVAYKQNDVTKYSMTPVAMQLIGSPGIPGILEAEQKLVNNTAVLEVTDDKSKKTKSYNIVIQSGAHGVVPQPLSVFTDKDPMPDKPAPTTEGKVETDKKPEPAKK